MTGGEPAVGGLTSLPCAACSQLAGIFQAVSGRRRFGKPDVGGRRFIISVDFTPGERIFVHGVAAKGSRGGCPFPTDAHPPDSSRETCSPWDGGVSMWSAVCPHRGGRGRMAGPTARPAWPRPVQGGSPQAATDEESSRRPPGAGLSRPGLWVVQPEGLCSVLKDLQSCVPWGDSVPQRGTATRILRTGPDLETHFDTRGHIALGWAPNPMTGGLRRKSRRTGRRPRDGAEVAVGPPSARDHWQRREPRGAVAERPSDPHREPALPTPGPRTLREHLAVALNRALVL